MVWIGWSGSTNEEDGIRTLESDRPNLEYTTVPLSTEQITGYYNGFSNATLWPLLHYFPFMAEINESWYQHYYDVNKLFCDVILQKVRTGDVVWIHDYHLMLVPGMLREKHIGVKIGFFLHVPFPSFEIFRCIPQRLELIEGLLGADLIGFHTFSYVRHFKSCVLRFIGLECSFDTLTYQGRTVRLGIHPIGINWKSFQKATETEEYKNSLEQYAKDFANRKVVLSVSRLDYTKGIPDMLKSIAYYLENMPDKNDVIFLVIAVPSRESVDSYANLKEKVEKIVGEINGRHSQISSPPPVQFIHYGVNTNKLAALYSLADVALVLPLIDGMNLVAKEYISLQPDLHDPQSLTRPGTLILSEFTGASHELFNAQIINPYNYRAVAETIERSLNLPYEDRIQVNLPMRTRVRSQDAEYWANNFLKELGNGVGHIQDPCSMCSMNFLVKPFGPSSPGRKILFLDYDGTLTPIMSSPQSAVPSKRLLSILESLTSRKDLDIVIVSGRTKEFLCLHFGRFTESDSNVTLVAEHGFQIKRPGASWDTLHNGLVIDWKEKILPYLELYVKTTPGSFIEEKRVAIVWHYRQSDSELGTKRATDLVGQLSEFVHNLPVEIHHGKKIVEVSSIEVNKGQIVKEFLQDKEYTAALCVGDDSTDETMFRIPNKLLTKIKVGDGDTAATYRWPNVRYVLEFLSQISR